MPKTVQELRILIAAPSDCNDERKAVDDVFSRYNAANNGISLKPIDWTRNAVPALGGDPQSILNRQLIDEADMLIAVFWSKIGTPTPRSRSGTIEEIRVFGDSMGFGRVMLYFCNRPLPHSIEDLDTSAIRTLQEFKAEMRGIGVYHEFQSTEQFSFELYHHLHLKVEQWKSGMLLTPEESRKLTHPEIWCDPRAADSRLRQPLTLGSSFDEVARGFATCMAEFLAQPGA